MKKEYVYWKPIEKVDLDDFTEIEKAGYEYSPCNEKNTLIRIGS